MNIESNKSGQYRKNNSNENGFSLIEVLIALAIFTFIIGGVITFSINSIKANSRSQSMQEAIDNARFTMDDLAKKIRTSSGITLTSGGGGSNNRLFFIDNKTLGKYCYRFENQQMLVSKFEPTITSSGVMTPQQVALYNSVTDCDYWSGPNLHPVVGEGAGSKIVINGKFEVMPTEISSNDPHRGFVRIIIDVIYNDGSLEGETETHLQSGVSIADYQREDNFKLEANSP